MDAALLVKALILGIVEGLTEFLPISSTGHLILAADLLDATGERWNVFNIVIQTGAMLAVVWEYRARFFKIDVQLYRNLIVAFIPAAVLGFLFAKIIRQYSVPRRAGRDRVHRRRRDHSVCGKRSSRPRVETAQAMTWLDALKVGIAQCFALIPGTSRSGATIIGGMLFGLSRKAATEFSFFLAVPTLIAAGMYDLWKSRDLLSAADVPVFGVGSVVAFVSAFVVIRWLVRYVATHDFKPFAWYRIAFGLVVIATWYFGWVDWKA